MLSLYDSEGRKEWVDLGKGISILLVVLFHCEHYLEMVDTGTMKIFSYFRMPFFFFLSGYVFTSDYKKFSLRRKTKQIIRGIVWTYLVFNLIMFIPRSISNEEPLTDGFMSIFLGYESWFVVSLGVAQVLFALVLYRFRRLEIIVLFMFLSLLGGTIIKTMTSEVLPLQMDKAFFVVFFFGLGFVYRIYEDRLAWLIQPRFLLLSIFFFSILMLIEQRVFKESTDNVFWSGIHYLPLFIVYSITGIFMMLQIVKGICVKNLGLICYVGTNSLIFYYLNGGAVKIWRYIYSNFIDPTLCLNSWVGFILVFLLVCLSLFIASFMIKKYCPVIVGDKKSFNRILPKYKW